MNCPTPKGEVIDISGIDMGHLDRLLLDDKGRMKLHPAEFYRPLSLLELRAWANLRGRYGFPTVELVSWLKDKIGGRKALEIGAGNGDLGHHLGVPMTDSYQQVEDKETVAYLNLYGIKGTAPPPDVEKEDGENAVRRRKPQVVIGCYVTEKYDPKNPSGSGNYRGVRYDYVIDRCETFILIGNELVHGQNKALRLPHQKLHFPWLMSRAQMPELNRIWVWERKK